MTSTDLLDRVLAYVAAEKMRNGRDVSWTANVVGHGGRQLVAVTIDDVLVVREEDARLYLAIDRACVSFGEWRTNVEMLERSVRALMGKAAGNVNDIGANAAGGGR